MPGPAVAVAAGDGWCRAELDSSSNAAARLFDLSYSRFMDGLNKSNIEVDRKMLADLAVNDIDAFGQLAEKAKAALA